jgi:hypothetical protein
MSEENVTVVRRAIEAFNRRETLRDFLAPEVEWVEDQRYPGGQIYRGASGVQRSIEKLWGAWDAVSLQVEKLVDAGDQVICWGYTEARKPDMDTMLSIPFGGVWDVRDGLIVRVQVLSTPAALEAAGLSE